MEIGGVIGGRRSASGWSGRRRDGTWPSIHWLTHNCVNVENWVHPGPPRDERSETGWGWERVNHGMIQCLVYTVLGVCCTRCYLMIMTCRDWEGWLNYVFLGDGRVQNDKESDEGWWEIIMRNWNLGEFRVWVNLRLLIRHVRFLIQQALSPIRGLPNSIRQVVPLISHICSYPPYCSHLCPPSLFLIHNSTIITVHIVQSSVSISPCHDHELTLSTVYI